MDISATCRTCLCSKGLNPIFVNPEDYKRYSSALLIVAGIKVEINDGLPQQMCTNCINTLNNCLKFRKQCKEVEIELLKLKEQLEVTNKDIQIINDDKDINNKNIFKTVATKSQEQHDSELEDNYICEFLEDNVDDDDKPLMYFVEDSSNFTNAQVIDSNTEGNDDENIEEVVERCLELKQRRVIKKKKWKHSKTSKDPPYQETFSADAKKQRVICKMCNKDLSIRSIDTHMARMHPGADERKLKCELCDKYVFAERMNRHVSMMHGDCGFKCGYCKTEFDSRDSLVDHVTTCTAKKKKRKANESGRQLQECDICHKMMQKASLRTHKAIKHAGLGPVCEHCGKKFGNKFRLNEHYRAKHGYEKFKCSYCDFQSAGIMSMRNHERRHRGEKPFVCETCGAKFHAAYLLAQHRQSHRTEKLVKCDRCPARFKARNGLHAHRLARHARAAACGACRRLYACRPYARRHARRTHRGQETDIINA